MSRVSGKPSASPAPSVLYHLAPAEQGWAIAFDGRRYGHSTLAAATIAAVRAARSTAEKGHSAQVLMQRNDGAWGLLWDSESCRPGLRLAGSPGNASGG